MKKPSSHATFTGQVLLITVKAAGRPGEGKLPVPRPPPLSQSKGGGDLSHG